LRLFSTWIQIKLTIAIIKKNRSPFYLSSTNLSRARAQGYTCFTISSGIPYYGSKENNYTY